MMIHRLQRQSKHVSRRTKFAPRPTCAGNTGRRFAGLRQMARRLLEESYEIRTIQVRQGQHAHQS